MEKIFYVFMFGLVAVALAFSTEALNRVEVSECMKWEQEAIEYPQYFIKQWQADQCKAHDIIINAPVQ